MICMLILNVIILLIELIWFKIHRDQEIKVPIIVVFRHFRKKLPPPRRTSSPLYRLMIAFPAFPSSLRIFYSELLI